MGKGRATRKIVDDGPCQRLVDSVDASLEPGPDVFRRLGRQVLHAVREAALARRASRTWQEA